jgi:hypothetical protein
MTSAGVKLILCAQFYLIGELRIMLKCYICSRRLAECMVSYIDLTGEISGFGWMSIYIGAQTDVSGAKLVVGSERPLTPSTPMPIHIIG